MRYRQWKKNYKKKYGYNPSIIFDKRKRNKATKRFVRTLSNLNLGIISVIKRFTNHSGAICAALAAFNNAQK